MGRVAGNHPLNRGAFTPLLGWLQYADPAVAP